MNINLKKLLGKQRVGFAVRALLDVMDMAVHIVGVDGCVLHATKNLPTSNLRFPIATSNGVIGYLVGDDKAASLASMLALLAEQELEKKLLAKETLARYTEISFLYDTTVSLMSCLDLNEVTKRIVDESKKLFSPDHASLMLYQPDSKLLKIVQATGTRYEPLVQLSAGIGIAGHIFSSGKSEIINNVHADKRFIAGSNQIGSIMCAALKSQEKVIGVLNVSDKNQDKYLAQDLRRLELLASQAATALQNAMLFEQLERARNEEAQLLEVANSISSELQLDVLLEKIMQAATNLLAADGISLFLFEPDNNELWSCITLGVYIKEIRIPATSGLAGTCFKTGQMLNISDVQNDTRFNPLVDQETGLFTRNMLCMPISNKHGDTIGVVQAINKKKGDFVGIDETRLQAFSAQVAIALDHEELEENKNRIRQTFGRYLTDEIVTRLLDSKEGLKLGGQREKITLLTSDLRGFTFLSENLEPEIVVKLLNFYLGKMERVISKYLGVVDEFMGDGILVLFGAPTKREDDVERAVACAIEMQLMMPLVNQQMSEWNMPQLEMGIGINTGDIVVGNIGSEHRTKYGVVGANVNLTFRIESYTLGGQILIAESTYQAASEIIDFYEILKVTPKGIKDPINLYNIIGITGKYNKFLDKIDDKMQSLTQQIPITFQLLQEKHIEDKVENGIVVAASTKTAIITMIDSSNIPPVHANIRMRLNNNNAEYYAKVLQNKSSENLNENSFLVRITSNNCFVCV